MAGKHRITVNIRDEVLLDAVLIKAKELKKTKSRLIEEILWESLVDDVERNQIKVCNRINEELENRPEVRNDVHLHSALVRSGDRFQGALILKTVLRNNCNFLGFTNSEGNRYFQRRLKGTVIIDSPFLRSNDTWPAKKIIENIELIVRTIIKNNMSDIWTELQPVNSDNCKVNVADIALALVEDIKVEYVKFEENRFIVNVYLNAYFIPFHSDYIGTDPHFGHLDFMNVSYRRFCDVATKDWGTKYYRLIYIDTQSKIGSGGYFIGYRNAAMPLAKVMFEIHSAKEYNYGTECYDNESLVDEIQKGELYHNPEELKKDEMEKIIKVINLNKVKSIEKSLEVNHKSINTIKYRNGFMKIHSDRDLIKINKSSLRAKYYFFTKINVNI